MTTYEIVAGLALAIFYEVIWQDFLTWKQPHDTEHMWEDTLDDRWNWYAFILSSDCSLQLDCMTNLRTTQPEKIQHMVCVLFEKHGFVDTEVRLGRMT